MVEPCGTYVLRSKDYIKGDRYAFHEYIIYNHEKPESNYERLKYAETFDSYEEAQHDKDIVDPDDSLLDIVDLRIAENEY